MKFLVLLTILACAFAAPNKITGKADFQKQVQRLLSDALRDTLEKFRALMLVGDPSREIPVMDPYIIPTYDFEFDSSLLTMNIKTHDAVLTGLSDFEVHNIDMTMIPLVITFDATLPMTLVVADNYDFQGMVFNALPIYGNGNAHFEIGKLDFQGVSRLAVGQNGVFLRALNVEFELGSLKSETNGMLGGGDIDHVINAIIGDLAPDFFNNNSKMFSELISGYVLEKLNEMLYGMTLSDFIDLITGGQGVAA